MLFKGFAETSVAGGPVRRFLLDFDLSVLVPGAPPTVNYLDLDGATPTPDLAVRVTPQTLVAGSTTLELHLEAVDGRAVSDATVSVFLNTDLGPNLDAVGDPFPDPSHWLYIVYRADAGQVMPAWMIVNVSDTSFANDDGEFVADDAGIALRCADVAGPLHVGGGLLEGPATLATAVATTYVDNDYEELPPVDMRWIGTDAPTATLVDLSISTPSLPTFPLECFTVGLGTDHRIPPPEAPTVDLVSTPGDVDTGRHRYKVSHLLANERETKPSAASAPVEITDSSVAGRVQVTIPIGPAAPADDLGVAVTGRRVYRTVASASGDDGEYLRVATIRNNTATVFVDDVADADLGEPPADRLIVHYLSMLSHDLYGTLRVREAGVENRFEALLTRAPTDARINYVTRPPANRPRIRWQANAITEHAEVRLPTLHSGNFTWGEARVDDVPRAFGAHWFNRGAAQSVIEIGRTTRGRALPEAEPIGRAEILLASAERTWRDAPQAVCVELVEKWSTPESFDSARTRVAVRDLRYAKLDIGALERQGRHARTNEGVLLDLVCASPPLLVPIGRTARPGRPLRALVLSQTFDENRLLTRHTSIRAAAVPPETRLDLRATPADAPDGEYFGLALEGRLEHLTMLHLDTPSFFRPAVAADDLRLWVAVPDSGPELDIVRTAAETTLTTAPLVAEISVRRPGGLATGTSTDPDPFRHLKGLLSAPGDVRLRRAVVAFGHADTGTTATTLLDGATAFAPSWQDGRLRYLSGVLRGESRAITDVSADGTSMTTVAFDATPTGGDAYEIEVAAFDGLSFDTALDGVGLTGRVAVSKDLDRFVAARATPQAFLRTAASPTSTDPAPRAITARVYGVRAAGVAADPAGPHTFPLVLHPDRVNLAFRSGIRELDGRFAPAERDLLRARIETLPDEVWVSADPAAQQYELRANLRTGPCVFWMEPGLMRGTDAGSRAGTPAGVGLVEGQIDGLPRRLCVTVMPSDALPEAELEPPWDTPAGPPAGWRVPGLKAEVSEASRIEFLRIVAWSRDHRDDPEQIFWSRTYATFLEFAQEEPPVAPLPPVLTPLWIWLPGEIDPENEKKPENGLGFAITSPNGAALPGVLVTLDLDQHMLTTDRAFTRWDELSGWDLATELQMQDYAGAVTVASTANGVAAGDMGAGPGEWFLRIVDGRPWYVGSGSAYFGNTGIGSPITLPRIFT